MCHRALTLLAVVGFVACACSGNGLTGSETDMAVDEYGLQAVNGEALFESNCTGCHAEGGVGIEGVSLPLVGSRFVAELSDSELVEFLLVGRSIEDPLNATGILKPPKGGNPSLTEEDLASIVEHLRSLDG